MSESCVMKSETTIDYKKGYLNLIKKYDEIDIENQELKDTIVNMCKELFGKRG
jgi:hypothetical protein